MSDTTNINDLTIGQARERMGKAKAEYEELCALFNQSPDLSEVVEFTSGADHGFCIIAADRGWVWVGDVSEADGFTLVKNARCIRRWGTSNGLGELANNGPLANTELETSADIKIKTNAVLFLVPTERAKWSA